MLGKMFSNLYVFCELSVPTQTSVQITEFREKFDCFSLEIFLIDDSGGDRSVERGARLEQIVDLEAHREAHRSHLRPDPSGPLGPPQPPPQQDEVFGPAPVPQEQLPNPRSQLAAAPRPRSPSQAQNTRPNWSRPIPSPPPWPPSEVPRPHRAGAGAKAQGRGRRSCSSCFRKETRPPTEVRRGSITSSRSCDRSSAGGHRSSSPREREAAEGEASGDCASRGLIERRGIV